MPMTTRYTVTEDDEGAGWKVGDTIRHDPEAEHPYTLHRVLVADAASTLRALAAAAVPSPAASGVPLPPRLLRLVR